MFARAQEQQEQQEYSRPEHTCLQGSWQLAPGISNHVRTVAGPALFSPTLHYSKRLAVLFADRH
jgi:hypothetical protein